MVVLRGLARKACRGIPLVLFKDGLLLQYNPMVNLRVRIFRVKSSTFQEFLFADIVFLLCASCDVFINFS